MKREELRPRSGPGPTSLELERQLRELRLGPMGVFGLYALCFALVQGLLWPYRVLAGGAGVYWPGGGPLDLIPLGWTLALLTPAYLCAVLLRRRERHHRERLTRRWDSWQWFDHGVEMIGTRQEFSGEQEDSFARSAALDPEDPYARNNLGAVLCRQGRLDEALASLREAIRQNPEYFRAYSNLGTVHALRGEFPLAIGLYQKALRLNPRDELSHLNLGLALARTGNRPGAKLHLRQFLGLAPGHQRAAEVQTYLRRLG